MQLSSNIIILLAILYKFEAKEFSKWRLERRTAIREALANKIDPNFWPSRGRRAIYTRQTTPDEDDPFWANRGRSLDDQVDPELLKMLLNQQPKNQRLVRQDVEKDPFWANRGRAIDVSQNRVRALEGENDPFYANRGRDLDNSIDPFWANRGRSADRSKIDPYLIKTGRTLDSGLKGEYDPFYANRGRSQNSIEDPFWANRGRSADGENDPFYANRGRSNDVIDPFWANRGRSENSVEEPEWADKYQSKNTAKNLFWAIKGNGQRNFKFGSKTGKDATQKKQDLEKSLEPVMIIKEERAPAKSTVWKDILDEEAADDKKLLETIAKRFGRSTLYADEPGFLSLPRRSANTKGVSSEDLFWVTRGKRHNNKREPLSRQERNLQVKGSRALETLKSTFWPSRGKKRQEKAAKKSQNGSQ